MGDGPHEAKEAKARILGARSKERGVWKRMPTPDLH
jgi:hypothetical protein